MIFSRTVKFLDYLRNSFHQYLLRWSGMFFLIVAIFPFPLEVSAQQEGITKDPGFVAFLGAVSDYSGNSAFDEAVENAQVVSAALKKIGFEVTELFDFTKEELDAEYTKWCRKAQASQVAFTYFCGHSGNYGDHSYLIPLEADVSSGKGMKGEGIDMGELLSTLHSIPKKGQQLKIMIFDGCRQNPFLVRSKDLETDGTSQSAIYPPEMIPEDTIVILPTKPGKLVPVSDSSMLADALAELLIQRNTGLRDGLSKVESSILKKSEGNTRPWVYYNFNGKLTFASEVPGTRDDKNSPSPAVLVYEKLVKGDTKRLSLEKEILSAKEEKEFERAVALLLDYYDDFPDYRESTKSMLKNILVDKSFNANPFSARLLLESEKFDFARLASSAPVEGREGLNLVEARALWWGAGCFFDKERALEWGEKDAESGNPDAMYISARLLLEKSQNEKDQDKKKGLAEKMLKWLNEAVSLGDADCMLLLGRLYHIGLFVEKSFPKAEELFQKALSKENTSAYVYLGHLEVDKQGELAQQEDQSYGPAFDWYKKAYLAKEYKGAANLGQLYFSNAPGVTYDIKQGIEILKSGASRGDSRCMWILFDKYRNGDADEHPEITGLVSDDELQNFLTTAADFGYKSAVDYCNRNQIAYTGAGKTLYETFELEDDYELWKRKIAGHYTTYKSKNN